MLFSGIRKQKLGGGCGMGGGGQRRKNWDNCNRITIKMILKIENRNVGLSYSRDE